MCAAAARLLTGARVERRQRSAAQFGSAAIAAGRVEDQSRIDFSIAVIGGAGSIL